MQVLLVVMGKPDPERLRPDGYSPLIMAVETGRVDVVRALLGAKADVNSRWSVGRTPLLEAVRHDRLEVARVLLEAGANA